MNTEEKLKKIANELFYNEQDTEIPVLIIICIIIGLAITITKYLWRITLAKMKAIIKH